MRMRTACATCCPAISAAAPAISRSSRRCSMPAPPIANRARTSVATNRHIGSPAERVEDLRFLRGRGEYVDDVVKDGQLYAVVLRSQVAHGLIKSIDVNPALRLSGVHSVITASDLDWPVPTVTIRLQPMPSLVPFQQPVMAHGKVRYVGEPLALVLADSVAIAEDASAAVEVDIDPLPAITDRHASARNETLLFEKHGSNQPVMYTAA